MWNMAFESLLEGYSTSPVGATGFADDAGLLVTGISPLQMSQQMQAVVNWALSWGRRKGLAFAPPKTVAVLFTRKRKFVMPPTREMEGINIPYSETVKYLGVTLDKRLTWKAHINSKIRAAKGHLLKVNNSLGRLWGLSPKLTKWVYTGIVRPALTYGCLVWGHACEKKLYQRDISRLNRLTLLTMGSFRKSTPTAGLEVIASLMPLDVFIKQEATLAHLRVKGLLPNRGLHRRVAEESLQSLQVDLERDHIDPVRMWKHKYVVDRESFSSGKPLSSNDLQIFTDGSRINDLTGSGVYITGSDGEDEMYFHLGEKPTVFQGRVYAINRQQIG